MLELSTQPYEISIWEDSPKSIKQTYEQELKEAWRFRTFDQEEVTAFSDLNTISNKWYSYDDWQGNLITQDWVENNVHYMTERKLFVIGSDSMETPIRAMDPKIKRNVNGTMTLTFYLLKQYYDFNQNELVDNPFLEYAVNERKIKLKYREEWLDFIIKKVDETSSDKKASITAESISYTELSRTGYNIEFNTDLMNNIGSTTELAETIVEGSDWKVEDSLTDAQAEAAGLNSKQYSDILQERVEDHLYRVTFNFKDEEHIIKATDIIKEANEDDNDYVIITHGTPVYAFYSSLVKIKNGTNDQLDFIIPNEDGVYQFDEDDENLIVYAKDSTDSHRQCYIKGIIYDSGLYYLDDEIIFNDNNVLIDSELMGERLIKSFNTVYEPILGKVCTICNNPSDIIDDDYNKLIYLPVDSGCYLDTGYCPKSNFVIDTSIKIFEDESSGDVGSQIFYIADSILINYAIGFLQSEDQLSTDAVQVLLNYRTSDSIYNPITYQEEEIFDDVNLEKWNSYILNTNTYINNLCGSENEYNFSFDQLTSTTNLCIGSKKISNFFKNRNNFQIKTTAIYEGEELKAYLMPSYIRDSESSLYEIGMYDSRTNTFLNLLDSNGEKVKLSYKEIKDIVLESESSDYSTVYRYQQTTYLTSDVVVNLIEDGDCFVNPDSWVAVNQSNTYVERLKIYPSLDVEDYSSQTFRKFLGFKKTIDSSKDTLENKICCSSVKNAIYTHVGSLVAGDKYVFRVAAGLSSDFPNSLPENNGRAKYITAELCDYRVDSDGNYTKGTVYCSFDAPISGTSTVEYSYDRSYDSVNKDDKIYYTLEDGEYIIYSSSSNFSPIELGLYEKSTYLPYITYEAECQASLTKSNIFSQIRSYQTDNPSGWKIGLFLKLNSQKDEIVYVESIQLFKSERINDDDEIPLLIGNIPEDLSQTKYIYYTIPEDAYDESEIIYLLESSTTSSLYPEKRRALNHRFEKTRTITGEKSNRYNLLQTICENFECYVGYNIEHEDNGQISLIDDYENKKVYRYIKTSTDKPSDWDSWTYYNELNEKIEKWSDITSFPTAIYKLVPFIKKRRQNKNIYFKNSVGERNDTGFYYGLNLKDITRNNESTSLVTKLIVPSNTNEFGVNKMCTIQRAASNSFKQSYIYDFRYYLQQGIIDYDSLSKDLYDNCGDENYIGLQVNLALIQGDLNDIITKQSNLSRAIDELQAQFEVYDTLATSAQEELDEQYRILYEAVTGSGSASSTATREEILEAARELVNTKQVAITEEHLTEYNTQKQNLAYGQLWADKYSSQLSAAKKSLVQIEDKLEEIKTKKNELEEKFFNKYGTYIQEGTWSSEDYYDDELYYLDAVQIAKNSATPQVSYTINVLDIENVDGYEYVHYDVGDITFIEDKEFFGYQSDGVTPFKQKVTVTEITDSLDQPENNQITIQNYKSQFENLFQKVVASVQTGNTSSTTYYSSSSVSAVDIDSIVSKALYTANQNGLSIRSSSLENKQSVTLTSEVTDCGAY